MRTEEVHVANPGDYSMARDPASPRSMSWSLWRLQFGAYGSTTVYAWASDCESAFEEAVEWLDEHEPGHFVTLDNSDMLDAYRDVTGQAWPSVEPCTYDAIRELHSGPHDDEALADRVVERAEVDLTMVGHTTLRNPKLPPGPHYVPSWEWTVSEVDDPNEVSAVRWACLPHATAELMRFCRLFRTGWIAAERTPNITVAWWLGPEAMLGAQCCRYGAGADWSTSLDNLLRRAGRR